MTNTSAGQSNDRPLFWHYPNEWGPKGPGIGAFSAVLLGDWKLLYYHLNENFELFNITEDIGESNNLANTNSTKVEELSAVLSSYLKEVDAQLPAHKLTGIKVAYPGN